MLKTKTQIKRTWNQIGKESGGYRRKTWIPLQEFLDKVDDDLLDIGAGNCDRTRQVLEKDLKLYAVDASKEMLKHAPDKVIKIESDATKIPLKRKFKYITAIAIMHHLPTEKDRIQFLKEIKRLLAKEGEAFITAWYSEEKGDKLLTWGYRFERYYHFFSTNELKDLLEKAEITNYKIRKATAKEINYIIKIKK